MPSLPLAMKASLELITNGLRGLPVVIRTALSTVEMSAPSFFPYRTTRQRRSFDGPTSSMGPRGAPALERVRYRATGRSFHRVV